MKPTQEQVIAWANEVKLCGCKWVDDDDDRDVESLCDFATLAYEAGRKDENEACAKLCEQPIDEIQITDDCSEYKYRDNQECADAIRERGAP